MLAHELVHTVQHRDIPFFGPRYIAEGLGNGFDRGNKYEDPAYEMGDQVRRDLDDLYPDGQPCGCKPAAAAP